MQRCHRCNSLFYSSRICKCSGCNGSFKEKGFSPLQLAAAVGIIHVVYATETVADCLSLGAQYLSDARRCKLKTDLFLYRIRVTSYIMRIPLVDKKRPILDGSEENAYTLVNACNYYGEVSR